MIRKSRYLFLLTLCGLLSLSGCRRKAAATESETQTVSETETENATTERESETQKNTSSTKTSEAGSSARTTVKPSAVETNAATSTTSAVETEAAGTATSICPYCGNAFSTVIGSDGTSEYSSHVAQEQAWAEYIGIDTQPATETEQTPSSETPASETDNTANSDVAQCGYCYQWFTVSDGSYSAHLAAENESLGLPSGTEYIQCPICGYSYPRGSIYDNHVCVQQ